MRKLPELPEDATPIDPKLLREPGVRVGWFATREKSGRFVGITLSPAHYMGGDALEGVPAKLVVDVKLDSALGGIVPNLDVRTLFDAEDRPDTWA